MATIDEVEIDWQSVHRAALFCNDRVLRWELALCLGNKAVPHRRAHLITDIVGARNTLVLVEQSDGPQFWQNEKELMQLLHHATHNDCQLVFV